MSLNFLLNHSTPLKESQHLHKHFQLILNIVFQRAKSGLSIEEKYF